MKRKKKHIRSFLKNKVRLMHYSDAGFVLEFRYIKPAFYITLESIGKIIRESDNEIKFLNIKKSENIKNHKN
jgi:hypothetical protein